MNTSYIYRENIHNLEAPRELIPLLFDFVRPASVLDVGCGTGTWLKIFAETGIQDILGVEGSHVMNEKLEVPSSQVTIHDLRQPLNLNRKFDLVISLEVGEHLPESAADVYVRSLVNHGDTILFSAAIPGQGGQQHVNEQWPDYWQKKFEKHGFFFHDKLRPLIWENEKVNWWYRQNLFLITKERSDKKILRLVHPECFMQRVNILNNALESASTGRDGLRSSFQILGRALRFKFFK